MLRGGIGNRESGIGNRMLRSSCSIDGPMYYQPGGTPCTAIAGAGGSGAGASVQIKIDAPSSIVVTIDDDD